MIRHLTKRTIDALPAATNPKGDRYYDKGLRGFGVAVYPSGSKRFFVEYGVRGQTHRRRMTLGAYGPLTVDDAREEAKQLLAAAGRGEDPLADREQRATMPTFGDWAKAYVQRIEQRKRRPDADRYYLLGVGRNNPKTATRKKPLQQAIAWQRWRSRPLDSVSAAEVSAALAKMSERGKIAANRWLASLRACFAEAVRDGILTDNPANRVRPYRENPPRQRYMTDDERGRFLAAVAKLDDTYARAAFMILDQTGARLSEVLRARWNDVDLDAGIWRVPSPKAGVPQLVPLAGPTVALLRNLPRVGSYIVAGRFDDRPRADLKSAWSTVQKIAELDDVHVHDIRRTYAVRITKLFGVHIASKLLRHADLRITERVYSPLDFEDLRKATNDAARVLPMRSAN